MTGLISWETNFSTMPPFSWLAVSLASQRNVDRERDHPLPYCAAADAGMTGSSGFSDQATPFSVKIFSKAVMKFGLSVRRISPAGGKWALTS